MNTIILFLPFISALLGYLLAKLLIWHLEYPSVPKTFLGFQLLGIIPAGKDKWALKIGAYLDSGVIPYGQILDGLIKPSQTAKMMPLIEQHIDEFLRVRLSQEMPMISMFIGDKTIEKMKGTFLKEIENMLPGILNNLKNQAQNDLKIGSFVADKITNIEKEKLSQFIKPMLKPISSKICQLGLVAGFMIGLFNALFLLFF